MVKYKEVKIKFKSGEELIIKDVTNSSAYNKKGLSLIEYSVNEIDYTININEILYVKEVKL